MRFLSIVGNSFGCSASGERLVSAARDGDLQEAKALLDCNPRLARYSTFGVRNSPLHYSAAHGHHEIMSLLLESGVDINLRNYRGQTALMQACQHGHWEVVQTLILFKANIHRADYLNGATALHLAALNGHTRCIRLILVDYLPSIPNLWNVLQNISKKEESLGFNQSALYEVINKRADGGITALHMAALNGHFETVQLLLDMGASLSEVTIEDGSTIDLIGAGSTPLHYAACGGNVQCCQMLIVRGASLTAQNANGWTPLMVARSWHRNSVEEILSKPPEAQTTIFPSPFLSLPLLSIINIARECGWRSDNFLVTCQDPCVVCLERKCTVAAQGCDHEFCTQCAVYLCLMNASTSSGSTGPSGSIACPLCRAGIVAFTKLPGTHPAVPQMTRSASLSLSLWTCSSEHAHLTAPLCGAHPPRCSRSSSFRSASSQRFPSVFNSGLLCMGGFDGADPCAVTGSVDRSLRRYSRSSQLRRSSSAEGRRSSWLCSLDNYIATGGNG